MANRLINEQSPYLLQHAHNPVEWYPWGDEPFERAKRENKPALVSIGYAACHWCHVMEHESFENEAVAAYMNEHFISIKVDREEHPDVDHMYMDAVQAISGSGGWPLNVFVTPDRVPFYGGTYFPPSPAFNRPSWPQLLERMHEVWSNQQDEVAGQTEQMLQYLRQISQVGSGGKGDAWDVESCKQMAEALLQQADTEYGGFGRAPKFPGTMAISFLLEYFHYTKDEAALQQATLSLDAMIKGGIYDQLGGGFARYATDEKWLVPHFEKMLYDNALLILAMSDAYSITKAKHYKQKIIETIDFVERELREPSGGFYSALDADSEGVEGKFYTWTWDEWYEVIGHDVLLEDYFGVSKEGNWEHTNILHVAKDVHTLVKETSLFKDEIEKRINDAKEKLLKRRSERARPLTDDKSLLSWNALMNMALTKAGTVLQSETFIQRAKGHMEWMLQHFSVADGLTHVWKDGKARIPAKLDDYAYLIQALLQLASVTGDNRLIVQSQTFADIVLKNFNNEAGNFFYFTSVYQSDIPVRKVDVYDGAMPSANAVMAHNLLVLGICMERSDMLEQAEYMLEQMGGATLRYTYSFSYWAILLQRFVRKVKTIVCAGSDADAARKLIQEHVLPECYLLTSKKEISEIPLLIKKFFPQETLIFVCTRHECLPPEREIENVLHLISL